MRPGLFSFLGPMCFQIFLPIVACLVSSISSAAAFSVEQKVSEFASKPFVRAALGSPDATPTSVLSFYFGVDYSSANDVNHGLRQGHCIAEVSTLWFGGSTSYDRLCGRFKSVLLSTAKQTLPEGSGWHASVDGLTAQLVLTDQLSRNIFRGTDKAFAYDDVALQTCHKLNEVLWHQQRTSPTGSSSSASPSMVTGEFYPPYYCVMLTGLMHSESVADHETALQLLSTARRSSPKHLESWWNVTEQHLLEHKAVLDRFGRYPHRNRLKRRANTAQEDAWLADVEQLPSWAKSQL